MNKFITLSALLLSSCYSARQNELVGQVKKVVSQTPMLCDDYTEVDISLGVLRNGIGSMSKEDVYMYVPSVNDIAVFKDAAQSGRLVTVTYDVKRFGGLCVPKAWITAVKVEDQ